MNFTRFFWIILLVAGFAGRAVTDEKLLKADYRPRPPEMIVGEGENISGPLKDILDEAAARHGYRVEWRVVPFPKSLHDLEIGQVDIVPRVIRTTERENFVQFLGPIGYQNKDINFLVHKGQEGRIRTYEDLRSLGVGVKLKTAYFDPFDGDATIHKVASSDDSSLARMFIGGRFETIALLDRSAMEGVLAGLNFKDYAFADYSFHQKIGNFYGMSKKSPFTALFSALNMTLTEMSASGRVTELYKIHHVEPPTMDQ